MSPTIKKTKICLNNEEYYTCQLNGDSWIILSNSGEGLHINLIDYIEFDCEISPSQSWEWEYLIINNSDRPVHLVVHMEVSDSQGYVTERDWDTTIASNDSLDCYIESAGSMISHQYMDVWADADNADGFYKRILW